MKRFAILTGNIVSNVIVANSVEDALVVANNPIEVDESVLIGFEYDFETGLFSEQSDESGIEDAN